MTGRARPNTSRPLAPRASSLPWWALALPVLAFVALLTLPSLGTPAPSEVSSGRVLSELVARVQQTFGG
ncbi:hypothetical protein MTQ01_11100 [Streptomyces sp. XM4193]|uniref:hypothetical protein n=1 Tax=Streptomyces sp. XM4193 TaxID=2929782 RepID=UPI001FF8A5CD|nr:hypothetical protein [Streptomyces sp. XM4193]MCK1796548.1 hypothetical protein [Streptomyces sp. XM4193]